MLNAGRTAIDLEVTNLGDRPVQVGSHYHFVETNTALRFDRAAAYGKRLDIPAGTAVRFEPGDTRTVTLVDIAGEGLTDERGDNDNERIKRYVAKYTIKVTKRDMKLNDALPKITVDPETYHVTADGERLTCEPAKCLPLAQRYSLF